MNVERYWRTALAQQPEEMELFFREDARIRWHNTNEEFHVAEFIRANCEYPGDWAGEIERVEKIGTLIITVVHVYSKDQKISCHVTSFFQIQAEKIAALDEYWGDDSAPPQWRAEKKLASPIQRR